MYEHDQSQRQVEERVERLIAVTEDGRDGYGSVEGVGQPEKQMRDHVVAWLGNQQPQANLIALQIVNLANFMQLALIFVLKLLAHYNTNQYK